MGMQTSKLKRIVGTGTSGNALTVSSVADGKYRLIGVTCAYDGSPTQTGVLVTLNSGAGGAYDCVLLTGSANARYTFLQPTQEFIINDDDVIDVLAPAASGRIASIAIYLEKVNQ